MQNLQNYVLWIRWGLLGLGVLLAVLYGLSSRRPHSTGILTEAVLVVVPLVAIIGIVWVTGVHLSPLWTALFVVVGVVIGALAGRSSRYGTKDGKVGAKPGPYLPLLNAVAWGLLAASLAFFGPTTIAVAAMVVLLDVSAQVAAAVVEIVRGRRLRAGSSPGTAETAAAT